MKNRSPPKQKYLYEKLTIIFLIDIIRLEIGYTL